MASALMSVQKYMTDINGILRCFDAKLLSDTFQGVGNLIKDINSYMNSLAAFPEGDYSITTKSNDVIFKIRLVLTSIMEEMVQLRSFRSVAVDALWCLKSELEFLDMDIETFLKESKLTQYMGEFEKRDIAEAEELLDDDIINIDDLESVMKPASFKRLKKKLRGVENVRRFLENDMERKLNEAGDECDKTSDIVLIKLTNALDELKSVSVDLVKSITNGKQRAELRKAIFTFAQMACILLACHGTCGLISAGMQGATAFGKVMGSRALMAVAGIYLADVATQGIHSAEDDLRSISELLDDVKKQTSQWDASTKQTIINWKMLMAHFNELLKLLKEGGKKLKSQDIHDMTSQMTSTKKALDKFDDEIDKLETDIKKAVNS